MSSLRRNIASLFSLQLANYIIPLLTLPWLTRVLGPNGFGRMSYIIAVSAYFVLLADYGFNLSASREIAILRDDLPKRSSVFWHTLTVKTVLAAAGLGVLLLALLVLHAWNSVNLYLIGYLAVLGSVLTPAWYFQGTERLTLLGTITVLVRTLSVPAVFFFVTKAGDVGYALAINAIPPVVVGLVCMLVLWKQRCLVFTPVRACGILDALRGGWHVFLSTASMSLYSTTNAVLLGAIAGNAAVGYFAAADKVVRAAQGLVGPVSQAVYPRVSYLMHHARREGLKLLRGLLKIQGGLTLAQSVTLFVAAPLVVRVIYGGHFAITVEVLRWMAGVPFLVGLSNVFGIQTMLPLGMHKAFSRVLIYSGVFNVMLLYWLGARLGAVGAGMAVLATEFVVTIFMGLHLFRNRSVLFDFAECK